MVFTFRSRPRYTVLGEGDYHDEKSESGSELPPFPWSRERIHYFEWRWLLGFCVLLGMGIPSIWTVIKLNEISQAANCPNNIHSACIQPPVRREWRTLTSADRAEYIAAVQCLATKPSKVFPNGSMYDDFPRVHQMSAPKAHQSAPFFPWHRYYMYAYETALKQECGFGGYLPYWDWSQDWKNMAHAPVWESEGGFGGDGASDLPTTVGEGRCVKDGPFADWEVEYFAGEYSPHCLSRGFASGSELYSVSAPISPDALEQLSRGAKSFEDYTPELERRGHMFMRNGVRGDFRAYTGPNDPVFFLHHVNLDRLWANWQRSTEGGVASYGGFSYDAADAPAATLNDVLDVGGLLPGVTVASVMDTTGGIFCYQY